MSIFVLLWVIKCIMGCYVGLVMLFVPDIAVLVIFRFGFFVKILQQTLRKYLSSQSAFVHGTHTVDRSVTKIFRAKKTTYSNPVALKFLG